VTTDAPHERDDAPTAPDAGAPDATQADGQQPVDATPAAAAEADVVAPGTAAGEPGARVAALTEERDTYLDLLRRERAEFENYRRRSMRERTEALDRGAEGLITQLLPVLDNFGYVLEAAKDSDDGVAKGLRMVHAELRDVLERAGLEEVPGVDTPFDPNVHDAVMQVEGAQTEDGEPKVAQVLRSGYRFKGRVLRPASVAVTQQQ
jgi:molecular chaperone GrpE